MLLFFLPPGLFLSDLSVIQEKYPTRLAGGKINFSKMRHAFFSLVLCFVTSINHYHSLPFLFDQDAGCSADWPAKVPNHCFLSFWRESRGTEVPGWHRASHHGRGGIVRVLKALRGIWGAYLEAEWQVQPEEPPSQDEERKPEYWQIWLQPTTNQSVIDPSSLHFSVLPFACVLSCFSVFIYSLFFC